MAKRKQTEPPESIEAPAPKAPPHASTWKMLNAGAIVVSTLAAQRASKAVWWAVSGKNSAPKPQHPEVSTKEALIYAAITGAVASVVRTSIRRGLSVYWTKSLGELPPGVKPLKGNKKVADAESQVE